MGKSKPSRTIVGWPLDPAMLRRIGALDRFLPTPDDFRPDGDWTNTYRIWTCHGYRESGNVDRGFLRIERRADRGGESFNLRAFQVISNDRGMMHLTRGEVRCRNDRLASPLEWSLGSLFPGSDGRHAAEFRVHERVRVDGDQLEVTTGGRTVRRPGSKRLTADWCLFEAVQRLAAGGKEPLEFDVLEGLSVLRPGHRLVYRGRYPDAADEDGPLDWFHQLGHGTLPYEYWLDERQRLVMVATLSRVYILDRKLEEDEKMLQRAIDRAIGGANR